jgi:hypothetical protein
MDRLDVTLFNRKDTLNRGGTKMHKKLVFYFIIIININVMLSGIRDLYHLFGYE